MLEQKLGQIRPGMDVCDPHGDRVGKVVEVHPEPPEGGYSPGVGYIHVEGEIPGRSTDLYIPLTEIRDVRPDCVVISVERRLVPSHRWEQPPGTPLGR